MRAFILSVAPLIASWMTLAVISSAALALVALALHRITRGAVPTRLVWGMALLLSATLTFSQPLRRADVATLDLPDATSTTASALPPTDRRSLVEQFGGALSELGNTAESRVHDVSVNAAAAARSAPLAGQYALVLFWPLATLALLGLGAWSYRRQHRALRRAQVHSVAGHEVHVTDAFGPAVFGAIRPRIVVPHWLLDRPHDEQRLVVLHERAHIAARDPLLLLGACATAATMPWNPGAWFMLSRLRLAIELDCDARVLREGATPRHYGALLIDLSAATTPLPPLTGAPAFSHRASHLERRLRTMTDRPTSYRHARRLAAASLATLAFMAACGAELPTSAELQGMDVAAAEKRAFVATPDMTAASYVVDGKAVTEAEAKSIAADRIASIEISKLGKRRSEVRIATQKQSTTAAAGADTAGSAKRMLVAVRADGTADSSRTLLIGDTIRFTRKDGDSSRTLLPGEPVRFLRKGTSDVLVFVDGVKATEEAMKMPPDRIERIEVIKGAAAEKIYGPEGAKGVIVITTKK